jgi:hypothetical protein
MNANTPDDEDLFYFRAEAAKVLGNSQPNPNTAPAPTPNEPAKAENPTTKSPPQPTQNPKP